MKRVAIVQARMGSTRLPGKVLLDVMGQTMLERVVNRTHRAKAIDEVIVATTTEPADDAVESVCHKNKWGCFRGSEHDALDRYYQAALTHGAGIVVRITADCPLIEPQVVDRVVKEFLDRQPHVDYACNFLPQRTFPRGLETEVMRFDVLERAWREDKDPIWREHVTVYIYRNPHFFHLHGVADVLDNSHMRWTVDTAEDLAFVRRIYAHFRDDDFSWVEVLNALKENREWLEINKNIVQREI